VVIANANPKLAKLSKRKKGGGRGFIRVENKYGTIDVTDIIDFDHASFVVLK